MAFSFQQLVNAAAGSRARSDQPGQPVPGVPGPGVPGPLPGGDTGPGGYVDHNNLGGLSTWGGLYAGGKFWRGPSELLQALRRGELSLGGLGQVHFGLNSDPNASYSNPGLGNGSYDVSGGTLPSGGFTRGQGHFGSEADFNRFVGAFGNGQQGGMRYKLLQALGLL